MVDVSESMETKYLTADVVMSSPTKIGILLDEGKYEETDFGRKLTMNIQIDGKTKIWRPNRDSTKNLSRDFGSTDSAAWIGKKIALEVVSLGGKDSVIAKAANGQ